MGSQQLEDAARATIQAYLKMNVQGGREVEQLEVDFIKFLILLGLQAKYFT